MTYTERLRQQLLAQAQPRDHWDRPGGDWEGHPCQSPLLVCSRRSEADSAYRIGSKTLHRGEAETAESLCPGGPAPGSRSFVCLPLLLAPLRPPGRRNDDVNGWGTAHL
ncbi:hypothetical protein SRIMR7_42350 (plasmid) [Streptomyces rimosus subsp. rimosus]|uniref:Uncharacterized protein n=1 Tax=Streptomyces rimosus subsp. rimosus TaxID=132474 RepID=A0ABY3ZK83_STRRM|nr:hypothetical protein SRIMR7_42350 [Streptomyces rimosus subsp. rimosus]